MHFPLPVNPPNFQHFTCFSCGFENTSRLYLQVLDMVIVIYCCKHLHLLWGQKLAFGPWWWQLEMDLLPDFLWLGTAWIHWRVVCLCSLVAAIRVLRHWKICIIYTQVWYILLYFSWTNVSCMLLWCNFVIL